QTRNTVCTYRCSCYSIDLPFPTPSTKSPRIEMCLLSESVPMKTTNTTLLVLLCLLALSGMMLGACQRSPETTNTNLNTNISNANANVSTAANTNTTTQPISTIAAREPDKYQGTLVFTAETQGGEKTIGIPTLSAQVARSGDDRRLAFKLPDGSDLIYLDHNGVPYATAPARTQYTS